MTRREEINEEMKREIKAFAEKMCSLIDSMERLVKAHEENERALAAHIDQSDTKEVAVH